MLCVFITTTVRWGACFYKQIGEVEGGWESTCGLGFSPGGGRGDIASECWLRKVFVDDCFSWILFFGESGGCDGCVLDIKRIMQHPCCSYFIF